MATQSERISQLWKAADDAQEQLSQLSTIVDRMWNTATAIQARIDDDNARDGDYERVERLFSLISKIASSSEGLKYDCAGSC